MFCGDEQSGDCFLSDFELPGSMSARLDFMDVDVDVDYADLLPSLAGWSASEREALGISGLDRVVNGWDLLFGW
jgi:hypothetical protein